MVRQLGLVAVLAAAVALMLADNAFARGHKGCSSCGSSGSCGSCGSCESGGSCGPTHCGSCGSAGGLCAGGACYASDGHHASSLAPASLIVNLPADAKLSIDDHLTTSTSDSRQFTTPSLSSERDYHYTLNAEIVRCGPVVS